MCVKYYQIRKYYIKYYKNIRYFFTSLPVF